MRYKVVIKYDGSKFYGFQRQKELRNVQGYLEENLSEVFNEDIIIKGAGRTDRGVHANYQVVHFDSNKKILGLKKLLNNNLEDLKIKQVKVVDDNFHARFSVKSKIYVYKIDLSGKRDSKYYFKFNGNLNIKEMRKASNVFLGVHNFKNFVAGERIDYTSTILDIKIYKINKVLYIKFKGIGFFRYMVRNLVGSLMEIGKGKINIDTLKNMLDYPEIEKRLPTISPNGLYLEKVNY